MLLSSTGSQIYLGKAEEAATHFSELGYPCPHDWNPADRELQKSPCCRILADLLTTLQDLLEIACMPPSNAFSRHPSQEVSTPYAKGDEGQSGLNSDGLAMTSILPSGRGETSHYPPHVTAQDHTANGSATTVKLRNSKPITTYLTQFQLLSHREYLNLKRDWSLVIMHNAVAAIVGVFVGGLYFHVDTTISGFQVSLGACITF